MKNRTRPAPGPGRGHLSPAGKAKRARRERNEQWTEERMWGIVFGGDDLCSGAARVLAASSLLDRIDGPLT